MTLLVFFVMSACNFIYMFKWAKNQLEKEYNFVTYTTPPEPLPNIPILSWIFGLGSLFVLFLEIGLGYIYDSERLFHNFLQVRIENENMWTWAAFAIIATALYSYVVVYKLGEIHGVKKMKNTQLFISWQQEFERKKSLNNLDSDSNPGE